MQILAGSGGFARQLFEMRPGRFGIDEVRRHRRDAAPVVDAGVDELLQHAGIQVRRHLDAHLRAEDQARHGDGPQQIVERRFRRVGHQRVGLGAEILDDDFLDMAVALMQIPQGQQ